MHTFLKLGLVVGLAVVTAGLCEAQPGGGRGGRGGRGGPGGGGGGRNTALNLVQSRQVREELKITDEQLAKLPDAVMVALKDVLNEKQYTRLKQIQLQQRGGAALRDPKIQAALKLDASQKDDLDTLFSEVEKSIKELGQRDFRKRIELTRNANDKALTVMTSAQKKIWRDMTGPEFKFQVAGGRPGTGTGRPGTGRPGGGNNVSLAERFKSYDKDKDGKLSKKEMPAQWQRFFDRIDTNKDGVLDQKEQKAILDRFGRGRGGRGRGGAGRGRPGAGRPGGGGGGEATRPRRPGGGGL